MQHPPVVNKDRIAGPLKRDGLWFSLSDTLRHELKCQLTYFAGWLEELFVPAQTVSDLGCFVKPK